MMLLADSRLISRQLMRRHCYLRLVRCLKQALTKRHPGWPGWSSVLTAIGAHVVNKCNRITDAGLYSPTEIDKRDRSGRLGDNPIGTSQ